MRSLLCFIAAAVILAAKPGTAQQSEIEAPGDLRYDAGVIVNDTYSNQCLGFWFPIPSGWKVNSQVGGAGTTVRATHVPNGGLELLEIRRNAGRITLFANGLTNDMISAKDYVTGGVQTQIRFDPTSRELLRSTFAVEYGGRLFYRSDYQEDRQHGNLIYRSSVYTKFRKYFLGASVIAASQSDLDDSVESLQLISFGDDQPDPRCVVGDGPAASSGIVTGPRVRVSEGVSRALLVKKVDPQYPEEARAPRIQGSVVLAALIDTSGSVVQLNLFSGHPLLAPAAIAAVKEWKYKPYLLNGQPVNVETQVTVAFHLPPP